MTGKQCSKGAAYYKAQDALSAAWAAESEGYMKNKVGKVQIQNLVTAAMCMAAGIILPFFTGQIPEIGKMLLPMQFPVFICGLICGWQYGGIVGFILPLLRYALFGVPPMPNGIALAFEQAAYGMICGFLYSRSKWHCIVAVYRSLIAAMLGGRVIWVIARLVLLGLTGNKFTWKIFMAEAFVSALPGIILQLVLIPVLMVALNKAGLVHFRRKKPVEGEGQSRRAGTEN